MIHSKSEGNWWVTAQPDYGKYDVTKDGEEYDYECTCSTWRHDKENYCIHIQLCLAWEAGNEAKRSFMGKAYMSLQDGIKAARQALAQLEALESELGAILYPGD